VVLATGDPLCHGIAGFLAARLCVQAVEVLPNVSTLQLACARVGLVWQDAKIVSIHARDAGEWQVGAPPTHGLHTLEKALCLNDRLGGHLVSGHVDGIGEVLRFDPVGDNRRLDIRAPHALAKYIARKGSIAVDGCSLTTNSVTGDVFSINLIPHTLEVTTLKHLKPGSRVNLEIDLIARYTERMLAWEKEEAR